MRLFRRWVFIVGMTVLIFLLTYSLQIPMVKGYIHLGDSGIFIAALLIGPCAAICAAIGSVAADFYGGYFSFMLPTLFIKGLMGWIAGRHLAVRGDMIQRMMLFILCEAIMVFGYTLYTALTYGWSFALLEARMSTIQAMGNICLGMILCALGDRFSYGLNGLKKQTNPKKSKC
jgi:uncharacterized membrane protein